MLHKNIFFVFLLTTGLLSTHCTIQKRSFRNGYYVEWHHKLKAGDKNSLNKEEETPITETPDEPEHIQPAEESLRPEVFTSCPETISEREVSSSEVKNREPVIENKSLEQNTRIANMESGNQQPETIDPTRKRDESDYDQPVESPNLPGILSFIFGTIGLVTSFALAILILAPYFLVGLLFAIPAVILGFVANRKKAQYSHSTRAFGIIGLVFGFIVIGLSLTIGLIYALLFALFAY